MLLIKHSVFVMVILLLVPVVVLYAQDDQPSWCPVTETPILEIETMPTVEVLPDSLLMTYRDVDLMVVSTTFPVTAAQQALPTSDGRYVAYTKVVDDFNYEIWMVDRDDPTPRVVVDTSDFANLRPEADADGFGPLQWQWLPGTSQLIFSTRPYYNRDGILEPIADDLWLVDINSAEIIELIPSGEGGKFAVSPDGAYTIIQKEASLELLSMQDAILYEIKLENYEVKGLGHVRFYPPIHWRPDASEFIVAITRPEEEQTTRSHEFVEVWQIPIDSLTPELVGSHDAFFLSFNISPDLTKVAYWRSDFFRSSTQELYVADIAATEEHLIYTGGFVEFDRWLLDAEHFAFIIRDQTDQRVTLIGNICVNL